MFFSLTMLLFYGNLFIENTGKPFAPVCSVRSWTETDPNKCV